MVNLFKKPKSTTFELHRIEDDSGISGTGHVLNGVVFPDGTTVVRWNSKHASTAVFKSYRQFEKTHVAYHGKSKIVWVNGINGVEFAYTYLQQIVSQLHTIPTDKSNKYIIAKLSQVISTKVAELGQLRNGKEISVTQDRGASQTSLSKSSFSAESFKSTPEDDDSTPKT